MNLLIHILRNNLFLLFVTASGLFSNQVLAENAISYPPYTFQYNAFPSDTLPVSMTQKYGFTRSKNSALVNITIIDTDSGMLYKGIKGEVSGAMKNLLAQQKKLIFKEIYEDNAYYYIAEVDVEHKDLVNLKISAKPYNAQKTYQFKFTKQFITKY